MILIDGFLIDAALSEDHAFEAEVSEYPVEQGVDIADHIRSRPVQVRLEGCVSDTPIGVVATRRDADAKPSDDAFAKLQAIRDARQPITIETSLRAYKNMVMTSFTVPRDAETSGGLTFVATFTQVQLVTNERTTVRVKVPRAAKKLNLGNKPAATVTAAQVPKTQPVVNPARPAPRTVVSDGQRKPLGAAEIREIERGPFSGRYGGGI